MLFTTGTFLFLYLPITLLGFFLTARIVGQRAGAAWLALASLYFYAYWYAPDLILLIASIAFNYWAGSWILSRRVASLALARRILVMAVSVNLIVLAYFKYSNLLIGSVNQVGGLHLPLLAVTLPIGISFFTFTQIAYLVDVYAGKVRERNPVHYTLFVTYFPHLIAGPVLHHAEMMPQFRMAENYRPWLRNFVMGLAFLGVGLAKKVLIADTVAPWADELFNAAKTGAVDAQLAWRGVLAYTLQIYFDFSGYSDMAVGLSRLVGVELPYNFNSPYKSVSIIDFWRRWHMTLSRFLRDYLYISLGGNRKGPIRRYVNLALTMLLGGLWHGASWTFMLWGGLHGLYLMINHAWVHLRKTVLVGLDAVPGWLGRWSGWALTLCSVMFAWIWFRAESTGASLNVIAGLMGGSSGSRVAGPLALEPIGWIVAGFLFAVLLANSQEVLDGRFKAWMQRMEGSGGAAFRFGAMIGVEVILITWLALVCASRQMTQFIYFNF